MSAPDDTISSSFDIPPPLDPTLYTPDAEELEFFKSQTGIYDDDALKGHILVVQAAAYKVYPYPCIRAFNFTKLQISRHPAYPDLLRLGREQDGAIFIDFGCCFGNDTRKVISDGYPIMNVIATDLQPEFWMLGHKLFNSSPKTFPVPFVAGDVFDPAHVPLGPPVSAGSAGPAPPLVGLRSLTPLQGRISAIHASSFFHLFDEADQLRAAHALAALLSPAPGSMIFGSHVGAREATALPPHSAGRKSMFFHSPESWRVLWDGVVVEKGSVFVDAEMRALPRSGAPPMQVESTVVFELLVWRVKRI